MVNRFGGDNSDGAGKSGTRTGFLAVVAVAAGAGIGNRTVTKCLTVGTRSAGDGEQETLHLGSECAALGFFLGKAEGPIEAGGDVAGDENPVQAGVLLVARLVGLEHRDAKADQGIKP